MVTKDQTVQEIFIEDRVCKEKQSASVISEGRIAISLKGLTGKWLLWQLLATQFPQEIVETVSHLELKVYIFLFKSLMKTRGRNPIIFKFYSDNSWVLGS